MKVMYDHQIFSLQVFGGISRYFFELMKAYGAMDGISYSLSAPFTNNHYLKSLPDARHRTFFEKTGIPGKKTLLDFLNRPASLRTLRRGDYQVFHPTYYDPYFLAAIGNRPYVVTVHDMIHELFPERFTPRHDISGPKKALVGRAAQIIAVSENTKRDLLRFHALDPAKIHVIYHASSLPRPKAGDSRLPMLPENYLLFVGNRDSYKNFLRFAEGVAPLLAEDASLHIVCAGGGPFSPAERAQTDGLGISRQLLQMSVSDTALQQLYARARAFVFPSFYEGFGIPILEAFESGCPIALSQGSCFPEIAGDAAVYFNPQEPASIGAAVKSLLADGDLRDRLKALGRERVKAFTWEAAARKTREVYELAAAR